ncbi:putative phosphoadenosine phosphosulfate reductase [bacterium HR40]|nr:putative phosphoadenosine phosphosulfate reductase [bacterium HR40]
MERTDDLLRPGLAELARGLSGLEGLELLRAAWNGPLRGRIALVSSFGVESAVLLDMVASVDRRFPVLFLDTGWHFPETLRYRDELVARLGLEDVRTLVPDPAALARHDPDRQLCRRDPDLCCHLRKTEPLDAALEGFLAWVTGRKRYQGGLRASLPTVEVEGGTGRLKLNPLAGWSAEDIRHYRRLRQLPPHPLTLRGFASVGCLPCTTTTAPGEPPRAGRWRGLDKTECGIHLPRLRASSSPSG